MIDLWQEIYGTIRRNKLRTFLTGFAVAWGIFMLIVLLGAGNGLIHAFEYSSSRRALNSIKIFPGQTTKKFAGFKEGRNIQLNNNDLHATNSRFNDHVINTGASISQSGINLAYREASLQINMNGVFANYLEVEPIELIEGRFINELDIQQKRKVTVLSDKIADMLFSKSHISPIGARINAGRLMVEVIGIYKNPSDRSSNDVYVPFTMLQTVYNKGDSISDIDMTTKGLTSIEANKAFERSYRKVIGGNHRFDPTDESAIWIWNRFTNHLQSENAMNVLRTTIWIIGIFTLLSGIVGISNIMLITVKERTREFGIRKALGAKPAAILRLVIIESIVITTFFGYVGLLAGIGATEWMNSAFGNKQVEAGLFSSTIFLNPTVDLRIAIQATITLVVAGTLAGFFPARKAVRVRPIEALRAE